MQCASVWITADIWRFTTASVCPASRSASVSPTQTIGVRPMGQRHLGLVGDQLVALAVEARRSEWPTMHVAAAELGQHRRRRPRRCRRPTRAPSSPARPRRCHCPAATARRRRGTGTARRRPPRRPTARPAFSAASSSALAARVPFIFQLPTTSLRRVMWDLLRLHQVSTSLPMCWFDSISACACAASLGRKDLVDHRLDAARRRATARPWLRSDLRDRAP